MWIFDRELAKNEGQNPKGMDDIRLVSGILLL